MNDEIWKPIVYENIIIGKYEISNHGNVRNTITKKILNGNNPINEKGYKRVCLQTTDKPRKFAVHRLVMYMFSDITSNTLEVNHKDAFPLNNNIDNLEYVDRFGNAHHAAINHLYQSCENHFRSNFTNEQVEDICYYLSKGYSISKIIKTMNLSHIRHIFTYIMRIKNRQTWTEISYKYKWDDNIIRYKTYTKPDIEKMCTFLFIYKEKPSHIITRFPQYDSKKLKNVLKKIKQFKLYTDISIKYINQGKSSTTIENDEYYTIDIHL